MVIAVDDVQGAVATLEDGGIMAAGGAGGAQVAFEVAGVGPGAASVGGEGDREAVASVFGVVIGEDPVAIGEGDEVGAGAWVGQFGVANGAPRQAFVGGLADVEAGGGPLSRM